MKRFVILCIFIAIVGQASAWQIDKRPNKPAIPPTTEAELSKQMKYNGKVVPVEKKELKTTPTPSYTIEHDPKAAALIAEVSKELAEREAREKAKGPAAMLFDGNGRKGFWAVILVLLGIAVVWSLRFWANKALPEMPTTGSNKTTW